MSTIITFAPRAPSKSAETEDVILKIIDGIPVEFVCRDTLRIADEAA